MQEIYVFFNYAKEEKSDVVSLWVYYTLRKCIMAYKNVLWPVKVYNALNVMCPERRRQCVIYKYYMWMNI